MGESNGAVRTHLSQLSAAPGKLIDAATGASASFAWAAPLNPKPTLGNPKIALYSYMSTASATCVIDVGLYHYDGTNYTFLGKAAAAQTATATANTQTDGTGNYPANVLEWDTRGATHFDVRNAAPSAGAVTVKAWVFGSKSTPSVSA